VDGGRVTVDVRDAELEDVLEQIATGSGFRLKTAGQLGTVTIAFTGLSLERALRRLARDHELMLVYGATAAARGASLLEVSVFAAPPSRSALDRLGSGSALERAALLAEIDRLGRPGGDGRGVPRLTELLARAPDPSVRARAAQALGRVGGAGAGPPLTGALSDQAASVRLQAAYALRSVAGPAAIPALGGLLLADPNAAVRRAAARMLGAMPDPAATAALDAAVTDADAGVRLDVSRALQRRGLSAPR
jgi:hypothetical protein